MKHLIVVVTMLLSSQSVTANSNNDMCRKYVEVYLGGKINLGVTTLDSDEKAASMLKALFQGIDGIPRTQLFKCEITESRVIIEKLPNTQIDH